MGRERRLDLTLPPELAPKRPLEEDVGAGAEAPEAKRAKTATETEEASLEDGLALLVQNALSNVGDMVDQFTNGQEPAPEPPASDPIEVDTSIRAPESPVIRTTFRSDPQKFIRDANVHALGSLALSLLLILVQRPVEDAIKLARASDSQHDRAFGKLKCAFENVRDMYSSGPSLSASQLDFQDADSQTFIELANLAQLGLWLVDGTPQALSEADENFLAISQCQQLSELPPEMTELYLGIKTQRAIEFLVEKEPSKRSEEVIGEVLTRGLEDALKEQRGGGQLTSADQSFASSVQTRKETLQGEVKEESEPAVALREKHPAEDLLRSFLEHATDRLRSLTEIGDKLGIAVEIGDSESRSEQIAEAARDADLDLDELSSFFEKTASGLVQNALAGLTDEPATTASTEGEEEGEAAPSRTENKADAALSRTNGKVDLMTDYKELEALVAESTSNYVKTTLHGLSPACFQPGASGGTTESAAAQLPCLTQLQHHQAQNPYYTYTQPTPEPQPPTAPGETLPPNQTCPSSVLYDKARQAAISKTSAHTRREGLHSARRPWTQEEEKALMAGLDMVKGPHWSQILTLFGQNGTISDILRDRTQVQLKDKARNLKLFFLKTNSEMPYYLQAVTGELKTRAPTQAARKEAEERARLNSEEDQAKLQGIMALAGGLKHPPNGPTPAQAAQAASSAPPPPQQEQEVGRQANEADRGAQATSAPRPMATPASQTRPGGQANTQQPLHSAAQANTRPRAQLPPQVPRPQGQQTRQPATKTQQVQGPWQPPAAQQHHASTAQPPATRPAPTGTSPAAAPPQPASSTTSPARAQAQALSPQPRQAAARPAPTPSPAPAPAPAPAAAAQKHPSPPSEAPNPDSPTQQEQDDNAAEAALLQSLQAVAAQGLAS
ncbi:Telomere repeat-binding factor, dimerization domain protein [Metarhizium album ARSEF 1941]|uniref:Telomere repeat-binding factor, dimerization domain protein n=1 Tax=Metarhizium album (strain ARSEF 1941) TaxID=1081103 RepID=A0A0B2WW58_METAS|nr:Telomere repeat-binding factor, dimerization domain protein [Metarhizium album ARSEF 1941]KHN98268.1 Telomere repeat-binding factor, dimerization domain protein [Metarhizium album ARSEF 1941]